MKRNLVKEASDRLKLLKWMQAKERFYTHDVQEWGVRNHSNCANRNKQDFCEKNYIVKIINFKTNEGLYQITDILKFTDLGKAKRCSKKLFKKVGK